MALVQRLTAISLVSICSLCPAAEAASAVVVDLCQEGLVVIEGSVGGRAGLRFLMDTGATRTVIDERVARRLRLERFGPPRPFAALHRRGQAYAVALPSLDVGPIHVGRIASLTTRLPDLFGCGRIDVILGLDLLRQTSFLIDYEARRVEFGPVPDEGQSVPFADVAPVLTVEVTVGGRPLRLMVDTAASRLVLFANRLDERRPSYRIIGGKEIAVATGRTAVTEVELLDVRLGPTAWPGRALVTHTTSEAYEGLDGVLGGAGAAVKRLAFDFEKNRLRWVE